jgi:hypothetical protein
MKLIWEKIIIISILFSLVAFIVYWKYHDLNFVEKNLKAYTGLENHILKFQFFNDSESFIEVLISNQDKLNLLKKFKFEKSFEEKLAGRIACPYLKDSDDFNYFLIEDGYGPYGYVLICLENKGNTLQVYEFFAD